MKDRHILVAAEEEFRDTLVDWLGEDGYQVSYTDNPNGTHEICSLLQPHSVVVDLNGSNHEGVEWVRRLRQRSEMPIIAVSGISDQDLLADILNAGADAVLTKPLSKRFLLAQLESLQRRYPWAEAEATPYEDNVLSLDIQQEIVKVRGQEVQLGPTEFRILAYLVARNRRLVPHWELRDRIWGSSAAPEDGLKWYIHSLRNKLGSESTSPKLIVNVRGRGYRYVPEGRPVTKATPEQVT